MPPGGAVQTLLSPAELEYLHSSLSQKPPLRPDARTPQQFRPLVAETDLLPSTNGSARVCFSDGTEAIVGIKAELEKSVQLGASSSGLQDDTNDDRDEPSGANSQKPQARGHAKWLDVSIEIPGFRDDDGLPVFLSSMLAEALLASKSLIDKLYINQRWHWRLYVDILLLSQPLSYPLPLLSLTTHLALLDTRLPRLISEPEDDPLFDDDWAAAVALYPRSTTDASDLPPITLLVMTVSDNIIFDPTKEELAVADSVVAVSIAQTHTGSQGISRKVLAIRLVDPPSRLTPLGVPNSMNPATTGDMTPGRSKPGLANQAALAADKTKVWSPPSGGVKRALIQKIIRAVVEDGGAGDEVLAGLAAVES